MERHEEQATTNCFCDTYLRITPSTPPNEIDPFTVLDIVLCCIVGMDFHKRFRILTHQLRHLARSSAGVPLTLNPSRRQTERELLIYVLIGRLIDWRFELCFSGFGEKLRADVPARGAGMPRMRTGPNAMMFSRDVHSSCPSDRTGCLLSEADTHPTPLQRYRNRNSVVSHRSCYLCEYPPIRFCFTGGYQELIASDDESFAVRHCALFFRPTALREAAHPHIPQSLSGNNNPER